MKRYNVESFDPYDMEEAPDGMWVMHDDAEAAIAAAVAAARAQALEEAARIVEPGAGQEPRDIREDGFEMLQDLAAEIRARK